MGEEEDMSGWRQQSTLKARPQENFRRDIAGYSDITKISNVKLCSSERSLRVPDKKRNRRHRSTFGVAQT